jgi:hypothetical protein
MPSTIITKNSSTAGVQPTAGQLTKGELAVNVTDRRLYTKDNSGAVVELGAGTAILYRDNFTGNGVTTSFTLPRAPLNEELVDVFINGLYQNKDTWTLSGAVLTFSEAPVAPDSGTGNIEVMTFQSAPIGETDANLVSYIPASGPATTVETRMRGYEASTGSSLIGFAPAGTGAVATNVQGKLRESVSVFDFMTAAQKADVMSGAATLDATASIQAALNAGAHVDFVPGNYLVTSDVRVNSYTTVDGQGATLKCGSMVSQSPMMANKNIDATGYTGDTNITIRNLNFDLQNTTNGGLAIAHAQSITIENCKFLNTNGNFHFIDLPAVRDVVVQNCVFENSTSSTMLQIDQAATGSLPTINGPFLNADNTVSTNVRIVNNTFRNSLFAGAVHLHKDGHSDIVVDGNHFEECINGVQDDVGYATGSVRVVISNNTFDTRTLATGHGIVFYGANTGLVVSGNTFFLTATNAGAVYLLGNDGTQLNAVVTGNTIYNCTATAIAVENASRCSITGNVINGYGSLAGSRYGIRVTSGTAVSVSGNVVASPGAAVIAAISLSAITDFTVSSNEITAGAVGVDLPDSSDGVVSGNMFNQVGTAVRQVKTGGAAENISVTGNAVKDCTAHAFIFDNIAYGTFTGNSIRDGANGQMGFRGLTCSAFTVSGNTIAGSTTLSVGIYISGVGYNIVNANRLRGTTTGIEMVGTDNVITSNLLTTYTTAIISGSGSPVVANNRTV